MANSSEALGVALESSPENTALRKLYLKALWDEYKFERVLKVARDGLSYTADDNDIKLYMAKAAYNLGKNEVAIVIFEELVNEAEDADVYLWYAKSLIADGNHPEAENYYKRAQSIDSEVKNEELEDLLYDGIDIESDDSDFADDLVERPKINFEDVGGMESVKEQIRLKIILPMQNPELFEAYGRSAGGGILLYGPPGCGKTFIARAAAGEANTAFISVGINEIFDMYLGESEKNLHRIFEQARRNSPCILFFDEIDALGAHRSRMKGSAGKNVINQFLAEMDNVKSSNEGLLIIGATNTPWDVDPAFRRPGRFDSVVFVPPPDQEAREEILKIMIKDKPVLPVDFEKIAKKTKGYSGADFKGLIDRVMDDKLRSSVKSGEVEKVSEKDLLKVLHLQKPTTSEWFSVARNYATYSNEGGQFDDILKYLKLI